MPDSPSFEELLQIGRAEQITKRPDLQVLEGDVSEMLLNAAAAMADKCIEFAALAFRDTFVDGAEGDALNQLVNDHWGLSRNAAVAATGEVTFSRTGTVTAVTVPAGTVVATVADSDGQSFRYTTDTSFSFSVGDVGPYTIQITAEAAGQSSNVVPGTVTRIVSNLADPSIEVSNLLNIVGGAEEESDLSLRQRVREYPNTLARGTIAALEFGAKQVPAVQTATVDVGSSGIVNVYIGDADGNASLQMISDVETELLDWACAGSVINVLAGSPIFQDVDYTITVRPGTDVSQLESAIQARLEQYFNSLKLGDDVTISGLHTAITNVDASNITKVVINNPAADIDAAGGQLLRAGTITRSA